MDVAAGDADVGCAEGKSELAGSDQMADVHRSLIPTTEQAHKFESSLPFDIPLHKYPWLPQKAKEEPRLKGRGKVSLILSTLIPGPHVRATAHFVDSCLRAECVVQDGLSTSEPVNTVYYTFEHKFPPEVEIANVTWKVKPGHLKIYFDKITEFSLKDIWTQSF